MHREPLWEPDQCLMEVMWLGFFDSHRHHVWEQARQRNPVVGLEGACVEHMEGRAWTSSSVAQVVTSCIVPLFIFPHAFSLVTVLGTITDCISFIPKEKAPHFSLSHSQQPKQGGRVSVQAPALCKEAQQRVLQNSGTEGTGSKWGDQKMTSSPYCLQHFSNYFFPCDSTVVTNSAMPP